MERFTLSMERIRQIQADQEVKAPFSDYFQKMAAFLCQLDETLQMAGEGTLAQMSQKELKERNHKLYEDVLPGQYESSYANPAFAQARLGEEYGTLLSFLYAELRGGIGPAHEGRVFDLTINNELFLEIYNAFAYGTADGVLPTGEDIRQIIYWHMSDYSELLTEERVLAQLSPEEDFAAKIIMGAELSDLRYLYRFGEYVSESTVKMASFLNSLPQSDIRALADTFTEGYRLGFVNTNKDLSKKKVVNIRYCLGFERIIRQAVENFSRMGLQPTIYRAAVHAVNRRGMARVGYYGAIPNYQYDFDHREDEALFLDKPFMNRRLEVLKEAYEKYKELAALHAGPAVMETFGENPFEPVVKEACCRLSEKQQKLSAEYAVEAAQLVNQYIKGEERSFTIIAFPVPEIGDEFEEIFREIVKINTLDYKKYEQVQQRIIDVLNTARFVEVKGMCGNRTDLQVALYEAGDPEKEAIFENCVADVNIPVGEVFTSPRLAGTNGTLHVGNVYLNGLQYKDLEMIFEDGLVKSYGCANFDSREENGAYIKNNVLHHHETLPLGEFAIGTNTAAYVMARRYGIEHKLPILIAEKMGPHFAVGDTCYSHAEDVAVYNPDGKEIVARDNEISAQRREDAGKAYFGCHTDITIPYDELGELAAVYADGSRTIVISDGRFVLSGCDMLNDAFKGNNGNK